MQAYIDRKVIRQRIRHRIRAKLSGSAARPRIAVFRSQKHIYAQAIDDATGRTLAHASSQDRGVVDGGGKGSNQDGAKAVGGAMAVKLKAAGIESAVFDRGGYLYHGRVKALADGLREGGVEL